MDELLKKTWSRRFDASEPEASVHNFSRPPIAEALSLLPIAYRVGSYISNERSRGNEPIFDLSGICLEPPKPGPYAGAPLGGIGGGSIGRGFKGEFRRWSIDPGRYVHRIVGANQFSLRVKRGDSVYTKVLSVESRPDSQATSSPMSSWDWSMPKSCGTYYARYPRAWTVYEEPVPGIKVIIEQISPFLPGSYSESSMPCAVFEVSVTNINPACGADVSVMFTFQNGYAGGTHCTACNRTCCICSGSPGGGDDATVEMMGGLVHTAFSLPTASASTATTGTRHEDTITGVCMTRPSSVAKELQSMGERCACCTAPTNLKTESTATPGSGVETSALPAEATSSTPMSPETPPIVEKEPPNQDKQCSICAGSLTGLASYSIAALLPAVSTVSRQESHLGGKTRTGARITTCAQFVTDILPVSSPFLSWNYLCGGGDVPTADASGTAAAQEELGFSSSQQLWEAFRVIGDIADIDTNYDNVSQPGTRVGAAVCLRQWLSPAGEVDSTKLFPFSLSWDDPFVRFGSKASAVSSAGSPVDEKNAPEAPMHARYYSRFFGTSGLGSPAMSAYALLRRRDWVERIQRWQEDTLSRAGGICSGEEGGSFYDAQLFNELYFLVDGGTVWVDSCAGTPNHRTETTSSSTTVNGASSHRQKDSEPTSVLRRAERGGASDNCSDALLLPVQGAAWVSVETMRSLLSQRLSVDLLSALQSEMKEHDLAAQGCCGDQRVVGQFLYLEGHEYLMYNTYDVHFYASFALLMLWPQLELSLQRDFARAVAEEDITRRVMMGTGDTRPRKVKGAVPHDLGSPSEQPWAKLNAYNFQDVSRWKDLGPKFILQVYRDYRHLATRSQSGNPSKGTSVVPILGMTELLSKLYPAMLAVMQATEEFDTDRDGMIENSGFPDQTYDIWTATGVHAYCGGLWIAACEAMVCMAGIVDDTAAASHYSSLACRARAVYIKQLWNGRYLNYDSSRSVHHDSIMADMLAGQWYARACDLPAVVPPLVALSCYRTIFQHNVVDFGAGKLLGAVNGMRPPSEYDTCPGKSLPDASTTAISEDEDRLYSLSISTPILPAPSSAKIDNCCMQSREVWTGTTYALAAAMVQEAAAATAEEDTGLTDLQRKELLQMARCTAQGIHDAGWQDFGYWFATPEGWERSGNYRSLGYMRALGIWAMQYAVEAAASSSVCEE